MRFRTIRECHDVQYMLMIFEDESVYKNGRDGAGMTEIVGKHMEFSRENGSVLRGGAGLKSAATATTVRKAGGHQTIHDGPFAESKEQLGGFYLIEAPDLDAAIAIAKNVPMLADGAIEIRPLMLPPAG